ncbi:MAG: Lrp/AsnC family transcriptional regulator for asnA, asnC and gidA [Candidatus Aldehydirespiratoraceae bacterium]|jgi:Lrp/AsnC family transcriptional regulator for asnA, asnC and gidA
MNELDQAGEPDLDDLDKAIVRALQRDGRLPYSQLGAEIGLSESAARQRVNRLTERGVMQIVAVTDPAKIGLPIQAMLGINVEGDISVIADELAAVEQFEYVVVAAGRFDILAEIVCSDSDDLLRIVNDSVRSIPGVRGTEILTYLKLVKQTYNWGTG